MLIGASDLGFLNYETSKLITGGFSTEFDSLNPLDIVICALLLLYWQLMLVPSLSPLIEALGH
jgi:hypothetical protein